MKAGVSTRMVWEREAQHGAPLHRHQLAIVSQRIGEGESTAEALAACGGYFPPLACDLVDVGERTGRLDEVLLLLAEHYEHLLELRRVFLFGILWPAIQLGAAIGIIGMLIGILGAIGAKDFDGHPVDVLGLGFVGTSGVIAYLFLVGLLLGGITVLSMALLRGWLGPGPMQVAMRVPVVGHCLQTAALSRFAWTLSMSLDAGLDAMRALRLAMRSTQNIYYTVHHATAESVLQEGREFHEALRATGVFPVEFLQALETAELAGSPGETLQRLANDYREQAKRAAKALTVAATFATWILFAGIMVTLIFRLFFIFILGPLRAASSFR